MKDVILITAAMIAIVVGTVAFIQYTPTNYSSLHQDNTIVCIRTKPWGFVKTVEKCHTLDKEQE